METILVFLLGKFHGQGSLAIVHGVTKESDTTDHAHSHKGTHTYKVLVIDIIS